MATLKENWEADKKLLKELYRDNKTFIDTVAIGTFINYLSLTDFRLIKRVGSANMFILFAILFFDSIGQLFPKQKDEMKIACIAMFVIYETMIVWLGGFVEGPSFYEGGFL